MGVVRLVLTVAAGLLVLTALVVPPSAAAPEPGTGLDPARVRGPDSCGQCHEAAVEVWKLTAHATGFDTLHRKDEAKDLAKQLGLGRRFKNAPECIRCHYTAELSGDKPKSIAGVSCESCHGAARDWIEEHDDFGGGSREAETATQRAERIARCESAGMFWPARVHLLARNCYGCHIVDDEQLVNAGHVAASEGFELVSWSQGSVRHNFVAGDGKQNLESSPGRRRVMFVSGLALDLEYSLRSLAGAGGDGAFARSMQGRILAAASQLEKAAALAGRPELQALADAGKPFASGAWDAGKRAEAEKSADRIQAAIDAFAEGNDGTTLTAIDGLVPGPSAYRGEPHGGH